MKAIYMLFLLLFTTTLFAQKPGAVDSSFGKNGRVWDTLGLYGGWRNLLVQPDDKIVAGGTGFLKGSLIKTFRIDRALKDGRPDLSFGDSGKVVIEFHRSTNEENHKSSVTCLALQADGKIVAGGYYSMRSGYNSKFVMVRLLSNGTIDSSFGIDGVATPQINAPVINGNAMVVQADGKIVVGGTYEKIINDKLFFLFRTLSDGSTDTSFGKQGFIIEKYGSIDALALQPDGKIIAGGEHGLNWQGTTLLIRRYLTNGLPDKRFGKDGVVDTSLATGVGSLALQPDGKILVTGNSTSLYRFNNNGSLDAGFGTKGTAISPFPNKIFPGGIYNAEVLAKGNQIYLLASGSPYQSNNYSDLCLLAYRANGTVDSTFATDGIETANYDYTDYIGDGALQSDGKIVLLTLSQDEYQNYQVRNLLRYYGYPVQKGGSTESNKVMFTKPITSLLTLYPNPAKDYVLINGLSANDKSTIIISDALGKTVAVYNSNKASQYKIDVSKLVAGVYYVQIQTSHSSETLKFIKE